MADKDTAEQVEEFVRTEAQWISNMISTGRAKELRCNAGLSLRDMAAEYGLASWVSVHNWESCRYAPSTLNALRYARALRELERLVSTRSDK